MTTEEIVRLLVTYNVETARAEALLLRGPGELGKKNGQYIALCKEAQACKQRAADALQKLTLWAEGQIL